MTTELRMRAAAKLRETKQGIYNTSRIACEYENVKGEVNNPKGKKGSTSVEAHCAD